MQLGVSSYSFAKSFASGRLDILGAIDWIADSPDAQHLELALAGLGRDLDKDSGLVEAIRDRAHEREVPLENYVVGGNFRTGDVAAEVARITEHLNHAHALGITRFRHDVVEWAWRETNQAEFEDALERIVPPIQELAGVAAELGITTSVENHGNSINDPERLLRLIAAVDRDNFKATLDVGNFLCVAADPLLSVRRVLPVASVVHLKDFRVRSQSPGKGWLQTLNGDAILGTVVGWGDVPLPAIAEAITDSDFDGPISIEFEGPEDDLFAIAEGLQQARTLLGKDAA